MQYSGAGSVSQLKVNLFIFCLPGETLSHSCMFVANQRGGQVGEKTFVCVFCSVNNPDTLNVSE